MSLAGELERFAGRLGADVDRVVHEGTEKLEHEAEAHVRPLFSLLREVHPILLVHDVAIVTRYDDVVAVLEDQASFGVEPYGEKMRALTGEFILGINDSEAYRRQVSILRLAAPRSDVPLLAAFAAETATALVAEGAASGRVNVADVAEHLPARLMGRWFGTPGPDEETMIEWAKTMFEDIFINIKSDPAIHATAKRSAEGMLAYVGEAVAARKAAPGNHDGDVLGRLIAMQADEKTAFSDDEIVTNLIGLIVGFIPTVMSSTTLALDALLDRPPALAAARQAALADEDEVLRAQVWEAMRLAPQGPGLLRRARADTVVGAGSRHATTIPAGTTVFAATESAMFDDRVVADPKEFRVERPERDYLHFGVGMHECFGRYANAMQIPAIAKAVLRLPGLARAPGDAGELHKDWPYPDSLLLETTA